MLEKLSFRGAFHRGDPSPPFQYLPFTVPPGTRRIEVSYHYDRDESLQPEWGSDDVVDIGIFDARGVQFLEGGFRGWTGSSKRSFFIAPRDATPGYIRGPLFPGEWNLFMSCRIHFSEVCHYWVFVTLDIDENAPVYEGATLPKVAEPRSVAPSRSGPGGWYRGDFHSHSLHSDGLNSIDEYAEAAPRAGLDFLAITDHNTISHFDEIARRSLDEFLLIPGEEVTTFWGHANVWGLGGWTEFRAHEDSGMQQIVDWVHERGGLFSPNHPKTGWPWEFGRVDFRTCEAWQGAWRFYNEESLDFWERRLRAGERVVAVGGSDCHSLPPAEPKQPWTVGTPCTWTHVRGPLDEAGVIEAVRAGHVFLSEDPTGPYLEYDAVCDGQSYMTGDTVPLRDGPPAKLRLHYQGPADKKLRLVRNGELWQQQVADSEDVRIEVDLPVDEPSYVRAEVMGFRGRPERGEVVHAMTNPIYVRPEAG